MLYPQPPAYARGECISLRIQLSCQQPNAQSVFELLGDGSATTVCLIQTMKLGKTEETHCIAMGLCWLPPSKRRPSLSRQECGHSAEGSKSDGEDQGEKHSQTRTVHCELRLPSDLVPSFDFREVKVSVCSSNQIQAKICRGLTSSVSVQDIPSLFPSPPHTFHRSLRTHCDSHISRHRLI
jgi:hypothetical protein